VNRKTVLCAAYLHFNSIDNCSIGNALENPVVFVILNLTSIEASGGMIIENSFQGGLTLCVNIISLQN
jgi:hypothetical protein